MLSTTALWKREPKALLSLRLAVQSMPYGRRSWAAALPLVGLVLLAVAGSLATLPGELLLGLK
jgi:hypothetical protein